MAEYFEGLFTTDAPNSLDDVIAGIAGVVTDEMNVALDTEPTSDEIREALF